MIRVATSLFILFSAEISSAENFGAETVARNLLMQGKQEEAVSLPEGPKIAFSRLETTVRFTARAAVVASKQEGIVNKVSATPTIFINGIEYVYDLSEGVIEDVPAEAYETAVSKNTHP